MARKKQSRGNCSFCDKEMTKGGLSRHLDSCSERKTQIEKSKGKPVTLYHLIVQDRYTPDFWLHLEMRADATFEDLDFYLRRIWLECCGHLSAFSFGNTQYTQIFPGDDSGWYEQKPLTTKVNNELSVGMQFPYEYDFGSTTELLIAVKSSRKGKPLSKKPIFLMARNQQPEVECKECGQPAEFVCIECLYEHDESGLLCAKHEKNHPHDDYGPPMELFNSPRSGVCGYDGPAIPPY